MAKKRKPKEITVAKWGGTDELGSVELHGHKHDAASIEVKSDTKLTDDPFEGAVAIIRKFTFGANPEAWKQYQPSKQELFNSHVKYIETMLWKDGMQVYDKVTPQIQFDEVRSQYHIFVGAKPARGHLVSQTPLSLTQIAHGV